VIDQPGFGKHLMLDCWQCDRRKISDLAYLWQVMDELPDIIGMTKITQPYVFPYSGLKPGDKGITGVVIIAESHITIHTFTERDYLFCDVFSCRPFDVGTVVDYLTEIFGVGEYDLHEADRGRMFDGR